jgi:Mg-chelatase subunit ChlD
MAIRFDQPEWLLALAAMVPMAVLVWSWFSAMAWPRKAASVLVRLLLLAVLLGTLAGATAVKRSDKLALIAVVDTSASVRTLAPGAAEAGPAGASPSGRRLSALQRIQRALAGATEGRSPDDLLGLVVVDADATALAAASSGEVLDRDLEQPGREGTDLAAGLRLARALFPADAARRVLLISDGNQTTGDALAAARALASDPADPIPVDVWPIRYDVQREVMIESVDVPARAQAGAAVSVRVNMLATQPVTGTLRLRHEGQDVDANGEEPGTGRRMTLPAGRSTQIIVAELGQGRLHRFEAVFEPDEGAEGQNADQLRANNRAEAVTFTPGTGSILVVNGTGEPGGRVLADTLRAEGLGVESVEPDAFPNDLLRLQAFDLVILQNASAGVINSAAQTTLVRYVTELGGGLVMVGGPESFGAGGYRGGPLEPVLPVRLELPERLVMPSAAVVFVIDASGSMSRSVLGSVRSQQMIANEGAALAVKSLDKSDLVGVIAFDNSYEVVTPLGPNGDASATARAIQAIAPGGGTNLPPALGEAYAQLRQVEAKVKHIIVLSDGQSQGRERLPPLAETIAAAGITISTIAVGDAADTAGLSRLAELGGGEYYRVTNPNVLPQVFLRAVRLVRTPMIREEPFTPVVMDRASPLLAGLEGVGEIPPLGGLTLTQARREATVVYPLLTPGGEPVLAHWQAGLGQVAAFTSDAHRWASGWLDWPGYRRLWAQIARGIARAANQRNADLTTELDGERLKIRLEVSDDARRPLDGLSVPGAVYTPDQRRVPVRLTQTGPGVYETSLPTDQAGSFVVTLAPKRAGLALPPVVGGATRQGGQEFRSLRSNEALLEQIAGATGGRVLDLERTTAKTLYDRAGVRPREGRTPLWPWLLAWSAGLLVLDVAVRKIAWDRLLSREFGRGVLGEAGAALRGRAEEAAATIAALRQTGEQVEARQEVFADKRLSDEDARRIIAEQRDRRRAAKWTQPPPAPGDAPVVEQPAEQPADPTNEGGLMAAKRRARERFGDRP